MWGGGGSGGYVLRRRPKLVPRQYLNFQFPLSLLLGQFQTNFVSFITNKSVLYHYFKDNYKLLVEILPKQGLILSVFTSETVKNYVCFLTQIMII